jgi:hypothetical protein
LDAPPVFSVQLRLDLLSQVRGHVDRDFGLSEVRLKLSGDHIVLKPQLLPSNSGGLVQHDHEQVVNVERCFLL